MNHYEKRFVVASLFVFLTVLATASSMVVRAGGVGRGMDGAPCVYLLVNSTIYPPLKPYLERWVDDVELEGFNVLLRVVDDGDVQEIRRLLRKTPNLVGALLVGELPTPWFEAQERWGEYATYTNYPCPLYYMDLDGEWGDRNGNGLFDSHEGDVKPEIWIGILKPPVDALDEQVELLREYFNRNHLYRVGGYALPNRAILYVDDEFINYSGYESQAMAEAFSDITVVTEPEGTNAEDYIRRILQGWCLIQVDAHGDPHQQLFHSSGWSRVSSEDIQRANPKAPFFVIYSCSSGRYAELDYIAGWYVFSDYGLAAVASTKDWAGLLMAEEFYRHLNQSVGEAVLRWAQYAAVRLEPKYYHGIVIIGDPLLRLVEMGVDTDGDALTDVYEMSVGLNPNSRDTDGDGVSDYKEALSAELPKTRANPAGGGARWHQIFLMGLPAHYTLTLFSLATLLITAAPLIIRSSREKHPWCRHR